MWLLLKAILVRWVLARLLWKGVGSLVVFLPLVAILKAVGWPLLTALAVLALPLLLLLFVIGLPVFLVLIVGGTLLALTFALLSTGFVALKVALIVALPIAALIWIVRRLRKTG